MDEFKDSKTLYDERKRQGKIQEREPTLPEADKPVPGRIDPKRPKDSSQHICEQWAPEGCKASQEAVKMGLKKEAFICIGLIPPVCTIQLKLATGKTIKELYEK